MNIKVQINEFKYKRFKKFQAEIRVNSNYKIIEM